MSLIGEERKQAILTILNAKGKVKVNELSQQLDVSTETIRRYLDELAQENKLRKVYGGAIQEKNQSVELPHYQREILHAEEKRRIGRKAAEIVEDNDILFIDEGSTTVQMIPFLTSKSNLTVMTNSFPAVSVLIELGRTGQFHGKVIFIGGEVNMTHMRVSGRISEKLMDEFYVDKAFISTEGVTKEMVTSYDTDKGYLSRKLIASARQSIVMADSSKMDHRSYCKICDLQDIDIVISDQPSPPGWQTTLDAVNIAWLVADA